jgi:hypothetical protein
MLTLTMRKAASPTFRHEHRHQTTWSWAPRISLRLSLPAIERIVAQRNVGASLFGATGERREHSPGFQWLTMRSTHEVSVSPDVGGRRAGNAWTPLERVLARAEQPRPGVVPDAGRAIHERMRLALRAGARIEERAPAVSRTLHNLDRTQRNACQAPAHEAAYRSTAPTMPGGRIPLEAAQLTEGSVNLLTERVIRQIDRRIVAYRERLGRPA